MKSVLAGLSEQKRHSLHMACLSAKIAEDYRGRNTVVLDLTSITPVFDYFVVSTGTSRRQMHAIAEEVDRVLSEAGSKRIGLEGYAESSWILQDYGDVVLHLFMEDQRHSYDLESLWSDAPQLDWKLVLKELEGDATGQTD